MTRGGFDATERQVDRAGCGVWSVRAIDDCCGCTMTVQCTACRASTNTLRNDQIRKCCRPPQLNSNAIPPTPTGPTLNVNQLAITVDYELVWTRTRARSPDVCMMGLCSAFWQIVCTMLAFLSLDNELLPTSRTTGHCVACACTSVARNTLSYTA